MKLKSFSYWIAECLTDSPVYNLRARTKREVVVMLAAAGAGYGPARKVTVEYIDRFDLVGECLGESGGHWESSPAAPLDDRGHAIHQDEE